MEHVLALGQVGDVDHSGAQPLAVGVLGGELPLDLVVGDDPAGLGGLVGGRGGPGVDQQHAARLQTALGHDALGGDVEDADLAGQDDEAVVGHPVARRAQAVAVQDRADEAAVGEGDRRGPVPGLHEAGVEGVEGAARLVHGGVVLPRLRDHHEDGVGQRAARQVQELQHLVEGRRVARPGRADREEAPQVALDEVGGQLRLARPHPVPVAAHRVDLAVVRDVAEGVRQRPAGEGVRGEAGVDDRQLGGQAPVGQVGEERLELPGGEHPLVDQGAAGQGGEVHVELALRALAQHEREAVEHDAGGALVHPVARDEEVAEARHARARGVPHQGGRHRHLAPSDDAQPLLAGEVGHRGARGGLLRVVVGEEAQAHGVLPRRRQFDPGLGLDGAEEGVGDLQEDAGAVTAVDLGADGAAVVEVAQGGERLLHHLVRGAGVQVRHEGDAAGVLLRRRVVQALGLGLGREPPQGAVVTRVGGHGGPSSGLAVRAGCGVDRTGSRAGTALARRVPRRR